MTIEKLKEALKILTDHNAWRRGDDTKPMTDPKALGKAIDVAQATLESAIEQIEGEYITIKKSDVPEGLGDAIKDFEDEEQSCPTQESMITVLKAAKILHAATKGEKE